MASRTSICLTAIAVCGLLWASACSRSSEPAHAGSLKPEGQRKPAPEFALKDAGGRSVQLSDYRGKIVLLNFWATWCGPCKVEIPWFMEFEQKYKDKGFAVLGVSMDEDGWDSVRPFVEDLRVNYRVLMGNSTVAGLYGGLDSLPTTFMVDKEGRIASVHVGLVGKDEYENEIHQLLGAPRGDASRVPSAGPVLAARRAD